MGLFIMFNVALIILIILNMIYIVWSMAYIYDKIY